SLGRIRPNLARCVLLVQHVAQACAVISRRVARRPFADQAVMTVDRDMVLVAEGWNSKIDLRRAIAFRLGLGELPGPARVAILLAQLRGLVLPAVWNAARLDRFLLFVRIALLWRGDKGGVDNLSAHRKIARRSQRLIEALKQGVDG